MIFGIADIKWFMDIGRRENNMEKPNIPHIELIRKKHWHLIDEVEATRNCVGVWLKRPYVFWTGSACTFVEFDANAPDFEPRTQKQALKVLNDCIALEAEKLEPHIWDKG